MKVDYSKAFVDGHLLDSDFGPTRLRTHTIADITITSGFITACDPLVCPDSEPFTQTVPNGTFPVDLSVAEFGDDQRVAFARIRLGNSESVRWEPAITKGQDIAELPEGHFFAYPVDSGTGCFMGSETAKMLLKALWNDSSPEQDTYSDFMIREMEKNYVHTWDWANFSFKESKENVVTFKSGLGDGRYPTFFGFDPNNKITELITDFIVVDL